MITKKFFKTKDEAEVTFEFDRSDVTSAILVGDFNDWQAIEMKFNKKQKDTLFKILLTSESELLCYLLYLIISINLGDFIWTPEMLRSSLTGFFIQFLIII